jgi:hypothetical protein
VLQFLSGRGRCVPLLTWNVLGLGTLKAPQSER